MEAITKTGKKLHGVIAAILVKKGAASPFDSESQEPKKVKAKRKLKTKK
jgi:hypothetical protein